MGEYWSNCMCWSDIAVNVLIIKVMYDEDIWSSTMAVSAGPNDRENEVYEKKANWIVSRTFSSLFQASDLFGKVLCSLIGREDYTR